MNKIRSHFLILGSCLCLFLLGCQETSRESNDEHLERDEIVDDEKIDEGEENNMNQIEEFKFENISKAPEASEKHPLKEVIMVFFSESSFDDSEEPIAINIAKDEIYVNPSLSLHSFSTYDEAIQISDSEEVVEILEKYDMQEWKSDYTFEDPETYEDGYSWKLWLQFKDGTVEKHKGKGTDVEKLTPENFHDFAAELYQFVDDKLKESGN